ncbi:glycosyltransferase family 15 protein [Mycena filopes]|nr:glycosyltransferase family 15 protein [Mycena filopes]
MFVPLVSRRRLIVLLVVCPITLLFLEVTLRNAKKRKSKPQVEAPAPAEPDPSPDHACLGRERANATLLMLARNSDLSGAMSSVSQVEDQPFTADFKREMTKLTNGSVSFGLVPREHWFQPAWIDEDLAREGRDKMVAQDIIYAESVPYRNMCRFNSGFFFKHTLLQQYKYYWRVEPDIQYFCDMPYDPFHYMVDNNKIYADDSYPLEQVKGACGHTPPPVVTHDVSRFIAKHPQYVAENNAMDYLSDDGGETYNLCHFWSNLRSRLDFWRGEAYQAFFDFFEGKGGFYYERWGDAPVHSIAAALFAPRDQLHFFTDVGYRHQPFEHCPQADADYKRHHCTCDRDESIDFRQQSCIPRFNRLFM